MVDDRVRPILAKNQFLIPGDFGNAFSRQALVLVTRRVSFGVALFPALSRLREARTR